MIPAYTKNTLLDALTFTAVSAHSEYPGTTGANEISGQTRGTPTVAVASGGQRVMSVSTSITVPACTIKWLGWWSGSNFLAATPNGGHTPKNFISLASDEFVYCPGHGYADDTPIAFWAGTPPSPLTAGTIYYVRDAETDRFKVAATVGGVAIDITAAPPYAAVVSQITTKTYASAAAHTVTAATFMVPD